MLEAKKHIHFIGIGGIGMSALAKLLLELGHRVSGTDIMATPITTGLISMGAEISMGHGPEKINGAEIVVYSSAISLQNPEFIAARRSSATILHRAQMLALLMKDKLGVAVTGTHGKTTTTSLIAMVLKGGDFEPSIVVGARVGQLDGNAVLGSGDYFVAEADESDGSFLYLEPAYPVITNIDLEHLEFYQDLGEIKARFSSFIDKAKSPGRVVACADCRNVKDVLKNINRPKLTYGLGRGSEVRAVDVSFSGFSSKYECIYQGTNLGRVKLNIPGRHNVCNSLAAVAIGMELGMDFGTVSDALACYEGAERRFQRKGAVNDVIVIEDYAHHPVEIKATVSAARNLKMKRIIGVFQPHRFTRTKYLKDDFGPAFGGIDHLVITDIYSAHEEPIPGVSGRGIFDAVLAAGHKDVIFSPKEEIVEHLVDYLRPRDLVLVLGAGDVGNVADELLHSLRRK